MFSIAKREGLLDEVVADDYLFDEATKIAVNGQFVNEYVKLAQFSRQNFNVTS